MNRDDVLKVAGWVARILLVALVVIFSAHRGSDRAAIATLRAERDAARDSLRACEARWDGAHRAFGLAADSMIVVETAPRWFPMADGSGAVLIERDSARQVSRWMR